MTVISVGRRRASVEEGAVVPRPRRAPGPRPGRPAPVTRQIRAGDPAESLAVVSSGLTVVALVCGWMLLQMLVLGGVTESRAQHLLYGELRGQLSQATAPTGALDFEGKPVAPGAPVALLSIPALHLQQVVVSGTASGDLVAGPGHLRNTPLPGQAGTSVVMGRARTFGGPFRHLARLAAGDRITVQQAQGEVTYVVDGVRRAGDPLPAALSAGQGRLTLVSAEGSGAFSALSPRNALYVDATTTQPMPTGVTPAAAPASERAMARDSSALPALVLVLAGLVGVVLAVSVLQRRFSGLLVWTFATPVVIAFAWATTDQVVRLLPNLM
jgi:sortase A